MATGGTAPPPLSIIPPQIEPLSDDDNSSPLSDVEDKDDDPDDLHDDNSLTNNDNDDLSLPDNLSDANDTEAETERLYDTPQNPVRHKDVDAGHSAEDNVYERTPSKLRQENKPASDSNDDDDEPLSDEDISMASSPPAQATEPSPKLQSPTLDILAEVANQESENRKRKRSSLPVDPTEEEAPSPKRTDSISSPKQPVADGDTAMADDDDPSANLNSGDQSADECRNPTAGDEAEPDESVPPEQDTTLRKSTRSSSRKLKDAEDLAELDKPIADRVDGAAPEEDAHTGEDEQMDVDLDEEAEAAHKNEEELERKKAAFEQLGDIEKRFATFCERLYEERLEQLNKEEEMLRADNPTHPDYLAMMEPLNARRDEKIRAADTELRFNIETSERWAVARRAQIHSQYFQSVRESRERILAELGQHWHAIQQERRKHANIVPDFGIMFPKSQTQRLRNALAYNKEVSILAGVAKYEGMPAAPDMQGATSQELEDDFDNINRNRQHAPRQTWQRPNFADYGGVPLGEALGPAGEQFLEQTAWANPNHPSNAHLLQRQSSGSQPSHLTGPLSGTSAAPRRTSHQPSPFTISSDPFNGNGKSSKGVPRQMSTSPEVKRAASLLQQTKAKSTKAAMSQGKDGDASF
ncbi:hypothetical protein F5Y16DRAFT_160219 [Xylariaceae sp. FL0255]|nr:hypothetical protein F5Y16DRAFT_160219 [Xylariaceae sp. FL0255]